MSACSRRWAGVPREEFVPDKARDRAYVDGALPIGHGQTISQPWVVAAISQALELQGGERVLDVGGGAGYSTAVVAELVRPGGVVRSFELVEALAERAAKNLARLGYAEADVRSGDGAAADGRRMGCDRGPRRGARGCPRRLLPRSSRAGAWCFRSPADGRIS